MADTHVYNDPFVERWADKEMAAVFSADFKFRTFRRLWIALAKGQKKLGLRITQKQIDQLEKYKDNLNLSVAAAREKTVRHDVMAQIYAYGRQCPDARPIIHLGATSCYVNDNTELIQMREGLRIVRDLLVNVMRALSDFALRHRKLPCLGYTHFQPAQLTTVGKRACLWLQDVLMDFKTVEALLEDMPFRGVKGTTGTQASFMELFDNDSRKVKMLDEIVTREMGFKRSLTVTGQTYTRKIDSKILGALGGIGESAHKFASDIRLLAHLREIEEPFGKKQVGSSAMAYKRNPMRSERMASLSRYLISLPANAAYNTATQWFERTLDDSANRRIIIPHCFLAADAILNLYLNVSGGLVVNKRVIERRTKDELPFIATENILMAAVERGGDRQELHELIRQYSHEAAAKMKQTGAPNDLLDRILASKDKFRIRKTDLKDVLKPGQYVGRAPEQVSDFIRSEIRPVLRRSRSVPSAGANLRV
jgi:adenylosuccinate lyase